MSALECFISKNRPFERIQVTNGHRREVHRYLVIDGGCRFYGITHELDHQCVKLVKVHSDEGQQDTRPQHTANPRARLRNAADAVNACVGSEVFRGFPMASVDHGVRREAVRRSAMWRRYK